MRKTLKLLLIIFPILFLGCGYSVLNKTQNNNFNIAEISMSGEKRINYNIRGKLLFLTSENSKNILSVNIVTNKKKNIKDKNFSKIGYFSDFQDLSFLIRNILKISNEESLEIIRQSIPEKNPILYREKLLKIF